MRHTIFKTRGGLWSAMVNGREAPFHIWQTRYGTFDVHSLDEDREGNPICVVSDKPKAVAEAAMDEYEKAAALTAYANMRKER